MIRPLAPFALFVIVQAADGRWNYGPVVLAEALQSEGVGAYPTEPEARAAALDAVYGVASRCAA